MGLIWRFGLVTEFRLRCEETQEVVKLDNVGLQAEVFGNQGPRLFVTSFTTLSSKKPDVCGQEIGVAVH